MLGLLTFLMSAAFACDLARAPALLIVGESHVDPRSYALKKVLLASGRAGLYPVVSEVQEHMPLFPWESWRSLHGIESHVAASLLTIKDARVVPAIEEVPVLEVFCRLSLATPLLAAARNGLRVPADLAAQPDDVNLCEAWAARAPADLKLDWDELLLEYFRVTARLAFERYGFYARTADRWEDLAPELERLLHEARDDEFATAIQEHLCAHTGRAKVVVALMGDAHVDEVLVRLRARGLVHYGVLRYDEPIADLRPAFRERFDALSTAQRVVVDAAAEVESGGRQVLR